MLSPGVRLGAYEILSALGSGGMGEVYKARDTRLDRLVAIKILPATLASDPQFRDRFDREARAISQLTHPHICTLYDVGHQDGTDFLVMEYLEGETLDARLKKGALPLDQALQFAIQIADALDTAHRAGIVHRDLKPGESFFISPRTRSSWSSGVQTSPTFQAGVPTVLFEARTQLLQGSHFYAITPDGQQFLFVRPTQGADVTLITVVVNWTAALKK